MPRVDSILIDQERRLAIIDGAIVTIGDVVGPRVVEQIDRNGVVLREPSGLSVRVGLRGKTSL
jgi:predicted amidohydrolase